MKYVVLSAFVLLAALLVACSMWFRADKVDAGITDQQVDSLEAASQAPDTLEGDSLEVPEEPPLLLNYPPEPDNLEAPETEGYTHG